MRSSNKKSSTWSHRAKIFSLVAILVVAVSGFTIANYAINQYYSLKSHAANGQAELFFEPSSLSVSTRAVSAINSWVTVSQPVDTIEVMYSFDPTKVYFTAEPLFADSVFKYNVSNTPLAEINQTGKGKLTLSMYPIPVATESSGVLGVANAVSQPPPATPSSRPIPIITKEPTPSPTDIPVSILPTGTFRLATFSLKAIKPIVANSYISIDPKSARIMGTDKVFFAVEAKPATLYLNSPVPPSPSSTPTPPPPTPTPPPGTCISTLKNVAYAVSSSSACKTGAEYANYFCLDGFSGSLGDGKTCTSTAEFDALAKSRCGSPHPCRTSPSPSPTPTPKPTATPTPPPGCTIMYPSCPQIICKEGEVCIQPTCPPVTVCTTPTPTPTPPPTPPPTADPSKSISCTPVIYKVPTGALTTPENLTSFVNPAYEVDPKNTIARPGELYLHGIKITNTSRTNVSTAGIPFQLISSPIIADRTREFQRQYTWAAGCTINAKDMVTCPLGHFAISAGNSYVPKQSLFMTNIDINPSARMNQTSGYRMIIASSQSTSVIEDCGTEMMNLVRPGCTSIKPSYCLNRFIGKPCPVKVVCQGRTSTR